MRARVKTLGSSMNFNSSWVTNLDPGCTQLLMDLLHMSLSPIAVCEIHRLPFGICHFRTLFMVHGLASREYAHTTWVSPCSVNFSLCGDFFKLIYANSSVFCYASLLLVAGLF